MAGAESNPIGRLQEHAQAKGGSSPQYQVLEAVGESHCPKFTMQVKYGVLTAEGVATNKKQAKHEAARVMLAIIKREKESTNEEKQENMEQHASNQEEVNNGAQAKENVKTEDINTSVKKVYIGNKIGELQEVCMTRGISLPVYRDGETTGPSHMRHFTMVCAVGNLERVGEGGTKKEAKRQAAGAVLEHILYPGDKTNDSKEQDKKETNTEEKKLDPHDMDNKVVNTEETTESSNGSETTEYVIQEDIEPDNRLEELSRDILEDQDGENTPEESYE